jgi:flagellar biosynthesis protein FlhF
MNLKRFTARTSRDALALVKAAFGDDAIVMSTKPCAEGVEVVAMAPESVQQLERVGLVAAPASPLRTMASQAAAMPKRAPPAAAPRPTLRERALGSQPTERAERTEPHLQADVAQDVEQLQMSTLSFQDYVRQRMLRRRDAERAADTGAEPAPLPVSVAPIEAARARHATRRDEPAPDVRRELPTLREEVRVSAPVAAHVPAAPRGPVLAQRGEQTEMMTELRSMRGLIEQRFGALAFMEKLQRHPRQAQLAQHLLDAGFSPALIRKLVESVPAEGDETEWAASILERNLVTGEREEPLEESGGVYALIGATGVGKTTSTAKLAAAFATRHGAANLGLITLDAYRVGAHEQLRTYGRILGVPVHTAHDRASLEDLLELLSAKKMVLIDTAGMAQRDGRTRELLEMLAHRSIQKVLVVDASSQGETIDDVIINWKASGCKGVILSKIDEAVKLAPALDALIRHKLKNIGVANGQRVPEDWHHLSANALVHRALKGGGSAAYRMDPQDVHLVFAHAGLNQHSAAALRV